MKGEPKFTITDYSFMALCIALNLGLGALVNYVKMPLFLDSVGTILATITIGVLGGLIVGLVALSLAGFLYSPVIWGYIGTAVVIVLTTHILNSRGLFRTLPKTILSGVMIGIAAAVVSAPVTTFAFGGISLTGQDYVTAFFKATGQQLLKSVFLAGVSTDPIDKGVSSLLVFFILRSIPGHFTRRLKAERAS